MLSNANESVWLEEYCLNKFADICIYNVITTSHHCGIMQHGLCNEIVKFNCGK